jgi:hypothetical protein
MTLCEAYLGIEPEFDMWNYFFRVWHLQDLDVELTVSSTEVVHVKSGHAVDPYFDIPMPRSMEGWRKMWFYLRNDASAPLLVFTGSHPVPLPSWGDGVLRRASTSCSPYTRPFSSCSRRG